jgi:hypothetical protein
MSDKLKTMSLMAISILLLMLAGCTDWYHADGIILDKDTHKPINHAKVARYAPETYVDINAVFSDSLGRFHYTTKLRDSLNLYFSKDGYLTVEVGYGIGKVSDTVYMESDTPVPAPFLLITH